MEDIIRDASTTKYLCKKQKEEEEAWTIYHGSIEENH